jgi:hypothetical protein
MNKFWMKANYSQVLFVCLMLNGTSAPVGPLVPR